MIFKNVQGLRGVAVLLVVFAHAHDLTDRFNVRSVLQTLIPIGTWGVDLFFIISGFIMVVVHWDDFGKSDSPQRFMVRRILRIFPLYWVVTLVVLLALRLTPGLAHNWMGAGANVPAALLLLPQAGGEVLFVAWTLTYEMYFYYVFAALLRFRRSLLFRTLPIWAAAIVAFQFVPVVQNNPYGAVVFGNLAIEFMLGALIGKTIKQRRHMSAVGPLALGFLALALTFAVDLRHGMASTEGSFRFVWVGLPLAAIVYGTLRLEVRNRVIFPQALQSIGDASYSIYLWHSVLYAALGKALVSHGLGARIPGLALLVLAPLVVIGVSVLLYHYLEIPLSASARTVFAALFPRTLGRRPQEAPLAHPVLG